MAEKSTMTALRQRTALVSVVGAAALLLTTGPTPTGALAALQAGAASDPTAPVVALGTLLAWPLAAWLLTTVALTAGGGLPGLAGGACRALVRHVAPGAWRRSVEVALGLTVVVGVVGAPPAAAEPAAPAPTVSLDWAAAADPAAAGPGVDLDWAAAAEPAPPAPVPRLAAPRSTAQPSRTPDAAVVVAPGDSLWAIAEQDLAARTGAAPSDADVAQAWPAWWAANRDAVGPDPHVIRPGTRLAPPAAS